jgi:hypothetical protein
MATLFTLAFAIGGWRTGFTRLSDNSFLWHLRTGRWILEHGIPRQDIYSFTAAGTDWVAQSWLAEVLYGLLDRAFGPVGVRVLGALTGGLIAALSYRLALRLSRDRLRALGLTLGAIGASFTLWSERPLFLGILALVGLLWVVEVPDGALGRRPLIAIPVLMWLWINVHGTFALGFTYIGLHLAGRWLDGALPWRGRERDLLRATLVALAVCMVNPYGPALLLFPIELLRRGDILKDVVEWSSPNFRTIQGVTFAAWLALFFACLTLSGRRPSRRDVVVTVPFLLLALWAQRNISVAPLVGLPVVARAVAARQPRPELVGALNRPLGVLVVAFGLLLTAQAVAAPNFDVSGYPVKAMRAVEAKGLLGRRLLTNDNWGGYLIARWWPDQSVFIDDRYDMYPVTITNAFVRVLRLEPGWEKVLDRYDIEVVLWKRDHPVTGFLERDPGWQRVYRDRLAVVFLRRP